MKRTAKIAFSDIVFVNLLADIVPKFFKYTPEKDYRKVDFTLKRLYQITKKH